MPEKVQVYVYDLAMGMAKNFSGFVGFQLEGIWHTAVVCFGREWFFGGGGIESCHPGGTVLGQPLKVLDQGETGLDSAAFLDYLRGLKEGRFRGDRYSLLDHNCNNFSNEVSTFLTGKGLPGYILELPEKVKRSPVAAVLTPLIEQATPRGENIGENFQPPPNVYQHFPLRKYVTFAKAIDGQKFKDKVQELVTKHSAGLSEIEGAQQIITSLVNLSTLCSSVAPLSTTLWSIAKNLLTSWPKEDMFPVLDSLRYATSQVALTESQTKEVLDIVAKLLEPQSPPTVLQLSLKVLCNLFSHDASRKLVVAAREDLIGKCNNILEEVQNRPDILQITLASLPLNYTVWWTEKTDMTEDDKEGQVQVLSSLVTSYLAEGTLTAPEAAYRALVALGALVSADNCPAEVKELALALDTTSAAQTVSKAVSGVAKVKECSEDIKKVLAK